MERSDIEITAAADRDMGAIFAYIATSSNEVGIAAKFVEEMRAAVQALSRMPQRHPFSRDGFLSAQGFRILVAGNYLAFFVVDEASRRVILHRVLHGKRNYKELFA
ncbi:MAG: type II toxin-antitoxin system RelE/ParE family toxin [Clostridiales Family XIII bacterium]|jgi:plasmid stabilization system protein ParE|nr:type II toxin-antitoxin system RelE/ParE family toxin [Clostridiales Family XIII bacterium]